ncbi:carboxylesterase family protein [Microbacterium jejuense]|uniref:Carboxylic ester hydrolase n=1 Tax=Microbacterium jejuense TaxID=1263637 RepID=A0ABS7HSM1_9MICO|nr:carboxylesterase family protein [Microbacterium jejuense]MBW9095750.1 carboxylesterase family protein [Microbacterium jejuense]
MTDTTTLRYAEADTVTGRVRGFWRGEPGAGGSAAFLGIPFAQPPVGDLRFAAPVPAQPWQGVRDALEYGATAQRGDPGVTLIPEPSVPGDATLNVNVFTPVPGETRAALPVLVWIHGGGYFAGSPASPWYDGRAFNRDGVVTVSISYRLGFDGFGWIEDAPSNRGVRDWLLALEWVQANIAQFGGDPSRVTIAGQSAGGGAVLTLLGMPAAQHLFHSAWALSAATADVASATWQRIGRDIAARLGVAPTRAGLSAVPEERIVEAQKAATEVSGSDGVTKLLDDGLTLGPSIDGDLITRPTLESIAAGVGADKPLVLGATEDEFSMIVSGAASKLRWIPLAVLLGKAGLKGGTRTAYLAANRDVVARGHAAALGRYVTDRMFRTAVVKTATARGTAPTWVYRYAFRSTQPGMTHDMAVHCIDVPFWFDCLDSVRVEPLTGPNPPQSLADQTHGAAASFVVDGDPGWPAWSSAPGTTRVFGGAPGTPAVDPDGYAPVAPLL